MNAPKILFVGAFCPSTKIKGGQLYACRSLIESPISKKVRWQLLDSTMESIPPPSFFRRMGKAFVRVCRFTRWIARKDCQTALIFCADGASFVEKGLMVFIGRAFGKRMILSPRSGYIRRQIKRSSMFKRYVAYVIRSADVIMCQSKAWKAFYESLDVVQKPERYQIVPNWINTNPYWEIPVQETVDCYRVLFLGWLEKEKGLLELIDAAKALSMQRKVKFRLIICGDGNLKNEVIEASKAFPETICYNGWVDAEGKMDELKKSHIFVLPSYAEGLPNSLLEAMAAGKACISTTVGAIPDVIEHNENGILIQPRDTSSILAALTNIMKHNDFRMHLSMNARATVLEQHDINSAWPEVLALLSSSRKSETFPNNQII